jgi:exodeoxyribonuclease V alpha subunit
LKKIKFICEITNLIYQATDGDYKIYAVDVDKDKYKDIKFTKSYDNVTIMGEMHELTLYSQYEVIAEEKLTNRGYAYNVKNIRRVKPTSQDAIREFLLEILTFNQVDVLLKAYPNIVDKVINNDLSDIDLNKTKGIKEYTFNVIKQKIEENFVFAELIDIFSGLINFKIIKKLHERFPSVQLIKEAIESNPYKTLCSLSMIGFKSADSILLKLEKEILDKKRQGEEVKVNFNIVDLKTSEDRCYGLIEYLLEDNMNNGNTRLKLTKLKNLIIKEAPEVINHLKNILKQDEFYIDKKTKTVGLQKIYDIEVYISKKIKECASINNKLNINNNDLEKYKKIGEDFLTEQQFNGIINFVNYNISAIIGYAGVGKSFSTKAIINLIDDLNLTYAIFAPTGRASKVIAKYTKSSASTIHRGLGFYGTNWKYGYNKGLNEEDYLKLNFDVIIVDETSMVDIFLMRQLLSAIDFKKTRLLFVGDSFQLPSVGAGNVFHDIIESNLITMTKLTEVFRYGVGGIDTVATKIRHGEEFIKSNNEINIFGDDKAYIYLPISQEKIKKQMLGLYKKIIDSGVSPEDICVYTSYRKGDYGTIKLNRQLQMIANKNCGSKNRITIGRADDETNYYIGDSVMQVVNNYKAEIYDENSLNGFGDYDLTDKEAFISNGDMGKIINIGKDNHGQFLVIRFDDYDIKYHKNNLINNIRFAYSVTVHKSQGGKCRIAILLTPKAHTFMLNSNLIYVGATRAEEKVYHLGEPSVINRAIKKKANFDRDTYLQELLMKEGENNK